MTKNLKLFTLFSLIWSIAFFALLNWALYNHESRGPLIGVGALIYGVGFAIAGEQFGSRDSTRKTKLNLRAQYAIAGPLSSVLIAALWVVFFENGNLGDFFLILLCNVVGVAIYLTIASRFIKGIPKTELFK